MSRPKQTLIDYVVIAINPVLVMLLVGSLAHFLLDVTYQGQYSGRLNWVVALFVMAAVLITRIAVELGTEQAYLYAVPLGVVTLLALSRFVVFRGALAPFSLLLNAGILGMVWFAAHKLTWDCTVVDESKNASGEGLLETVGLDQRTTAGPQARPAPHEQPEGVTTGRQNYTWWEQLLYNERRLHRPGLWVVYFSMAALPLFGIGQLLSPARDAAVRYGRFRLAFVYVAAALALLLTTSFLNLRRYLRQRHLVMSPAIAAVWLALGAVILVGVLLVATLLPRPNAEYALARMSLATSPERTSSTVAPPGDAADIDRQGPRTGTRENPRQQNASQASKAEPAGGAKQGDSVSESDSGNATGESQSDDAQQADARGQSQPSEKAEQAEENGKSSQSSQPSERRSDSPAPSGGSSGRSGRSSQSQGGASSGRSSRNDSASQQPGEERSQSARQRHSQDQPGTGPAARQFSSPLITAASWFTLLLKALLWLVLAVVIGVVLWRNRRRIAEGIGRLLANLAHWWRRLFDRTVPKKPTGSKSPAPVRADRPFSAYADPFLTGQAERWPPGEVVRYTFEAFEAWARDRRLPRHPQETPYEFAEQVSRHVPELAEPARHLTNLYYQQAYAPGEVSRRQLDPLRRLWHVLARLAETRPLPAGTGDPTE